MKSVLILFLALFSISCVTANSQPTDKCVRAGIPVDIIEIEQLEINENNTVKTKIRCERPKF